MTKPATYSTERLILFAIGIYLILLGAIFAVLSSRVSGPGSVIVIINSAREVLAGCVVIFSAYFFRLRRASLICAVLGLVLITLIGTFVLYTHRFGLWIALRALGYMLLIVCGLSFSKRSG